MQQSEASRGPAKEGKVETELDLRHERCWLPDRLKAEDGLLEDAGGSHFKAHPSQASERRLRPGRDFICPSPRRCPVAGRGGSDGEPVAQWPSGATFI